jgi:ABC-type dipeptide/oligopeptide/nickel transport system permease subunit
MRDLHRNWNRAKVKLGASARHRQLGRDIWREMMAGGQVSIAVGLTAMLLSRPARHPDRRVAGFFKRLDGPLMRLTDLFLALPLLPLLLVMVMLFREPLSAQLRAGDGYFILIVSPSASPAGCRPHASCAAMCWR